MTQVKQITPGVELVSETDPALPLVSIAISFRPGSLADPVGKEGLCRVVAALMRRCGGGREAETTEMELDAMGASMAVDVSHSVITFYGTSIARSLDRFVNLLLDVLGKPHIQPGEFERLKRETESELVDLRDNDRGLARYWFKRRLFDIHPYARPVIGSLSSVNGLDLTDAERLASRLVHAGPCVISMAGDIDAGSAEEIAQRIAQVLRPSQGSPDPEDPPSIDGRRLVFIDKPERTQAQILVGTLGTHPRDEDHFALVLANTIFGGTFTARMTQEIRAKRGWSYGAYSSLPYDRRRQAFSMWTFPKNDDAAACLELELDLLKEWRDKGVTAEELAWAKRYMIRSHAFAVDTATKRAGLASDSLLYSLPTGYYDNYASNVEAVSLGQANAAIRDRIHDDRLLIAVLSTADAILPDIEKAIDRHATTEVIAYDRDD